MRRAYKFRLRPTKGQHQRLNQCLDVHRELYNAALEERRSAYECVVRRSATYFGDRPKSPVCYGGQSGQLKEIRGLRPDIATWSYSSEQATLRRLDKAFQAFFRRINRGETPGYPRFKAEHRFDLKGIGHVKVTVHRKVEGRVKTLAVKRESRKWYLVLSCDDVPTKHLPATGKKVASAQSVPENKRII